MASMRAVVVTEAGGNLQVVETPLPTPAAGEVLIRVHACGVCHGDVLGKAGLFPGVTYPLIPGHEIAGEIAELGAGVVGWEVGQRVGLGWYGGACGECEFCRRGSLAVCPNMPIAGITRNGGYADYVCARARALVLLPDELPTTDAAPMMCAGVTTFRALSNSGTRTGARVAIIGLGGLGHLAVQFAVKLGFDTIAVARGAEKGGLAQRLGAHHYVDSTVEDCGEALLALGGVDLVVSTASSAAAAGAAFAGLRPEGKLIVLGGSPEAVPVPAVALIPGEREIIGRKSGTAADSQQTLDFSAKTGVRPIVETIGLEDGPAAFDRMLDGAARYRMVLTA